MGQDRTTDHLCHYRALENWIWTQPSDTSTDEATRAKLEKRIVQRQEHPKGFLFDSNGDIATAREQYPHVAFDVTEPV